MAANLQKTRISSVLRNTLRIIGFLALLNLCALLLFGDGKKAQPDKYTSEIRYPVGFDKFNVNTNIFTNFYALAVAGKIQVVWETPVSFSNYTATIFYSADYPEHCVSRDWRYLPMVYRGALYNASIPIDDIDIPVVYFIMGVSNSLTNLSPMRICYPRIAGLEAPSRPFWQFLEGFEESILNWQILNKYPDILSLRTNVVEPKNGKSALCITLPEGRRSISVATSRLRGWQIEHFKAKGFAVWVRTNDKSGFVQFSLVSYAGTEKQEIVQHPGIIPVSNQWKRIEINFDAFSKINLLNVDQLIFEFSGSGLMEFWIDDLSLTGGWMSEVE